MSSKRIGFLHFERNTLKQVYRERVLDWVESGKILSRKMSSYKDDYRKKICASCSEEQQQKRKCVKYTIDGKQLQSCGHMDSACGRKFKDEFDDHMYFHPALNRIKIINESEKIELELTKFEPIVINPLKKITPNI